MGTGPAGLLGPAKGCNTSEGGTLHHLSCGPHPHPGLGLTRLEMETLQ